MLKPKKNLGQHFLIDENIAQKIVDALNYRRKGEQTNLLEIGPGKGVLTKYLLKDDDYNLKVVEFDIDAINYLKMNFDNIEDKIIHADVLKLNLKENFEAPLLIIGNLPYNITAPILFQLLDNKDVVPEMVAMIQKEVAERIASKHGNKVYGILSVLLQSFYKVEYLFTVNENVFNPPPKVKSAVIRLTKIAEQPDIENFYKFKNLVKAAFNQRRKTLKNALGLYDTSKIPEEFLSQRAEQLSIEEFHKLYNAMK
ncbi:MAG: ribosomal RNA small subunit methyltransferase A [Bacteroidales bacterium]|nr:ribosomal RNA small subunit methyltransferase A [Bacteroidales bacterium]